MKDDRVYLQHILEAIRRIDSHVAAGRARFMDSDLLQDAVLRNLQTMAEATTRLSPAVALTEPSIDWRALAGEGRPRVGGAPADQPHLGARNAGGPPKSGAG